jgi:hypothetical protein
MNSRSLLPASQSLLLSTSLLASLPAQAQHYGGTMFCGRHVASVAGDALVLVDIDEPAGPARSLRLAGFAADSPSEVSWAPDCRTLAVVGSDRLSLVDAATLTARAVSLPAGTPHVHLHAGEFEQPSVAWSPTSRSFLVHLIDRKAGAPRGAALVQVDALSLATTPLAPAPGLVDYFPNFALLDDTTAVFLAGQAGSAQRLYRATRTIPGAVTLVTPRPLLNAWFSRAPVAVFASPERPRVPSEILRIDLRTGPRTGISTLVHRGLLTPIGVSSDGRAVLVHDRLAQGLDRPSHLFVLDVATGARRRFAIDPDATRGAPFWACDRGARACVGNLPGHTELVLDRGAGATSQVFPAPRPGAGQGPGQSQRLPAAASELRISEDGRYVAATVTSSVGPALRCPPGWVGPRLRSELIIAPVSPPASGQRVLIRETDACAPPSARVEY